MTGPWEHEIHAVTGGFGFTGSYIAGRLLEEGHRVVTLTNDPGRPHPLSGRLWAVPYRFDDPDALCASLGGVSVLYNNYWVRFNHRNFSFARAVENSRRLFEAARQAGVKRIVHISITNPSMDSPFEYFRGKAVMEQMLADSGVPHTILRPALIYGSEDILVNNIAWFLRTFPVFGIFGGGDYRVQPIHAADLAALAVTEGRAGGNRILDAVGPDTFSFREMVQEIACGLGISRRFLSISPGLGGLIITLMGRITRDVVLTRNEIEGLMADLLYTGAEPKGSTHLLDWVRANRSTVGLRYESELARRSPRARASVFTGPGRRCWKEPGFSRP